MQRLVLSSRRLLSIVILTSCAWLTTFGDRDTCFAQLPDFAEQLGQLFGNDQDKAVVGDSKSALDKPAPTSIDDFREIQSVAKSVSKQIIEATVGVQLGGAYASGVVVSEDGYVLTASHVAGAPGRRVNITFPDGRRTVGRTLGLNPDVDGALIKLNDEGPWPFIPMADSKNGPKPGDWCIATGHPGGFESGRRPPVRLGRIIFANGYTIRSDCPIEPGDSGGPLVDLKGNVIGVHSRIFNDATGNLHVPIVTFERTWDQLTSSEISQLAPNSRFLAQFDFNQDGRLTLQELPEDGLRRRVYRRMAEKFGFDVNEPQKMEQIRKRVGLIIAKQSTEGRRRPGQMLFTAPGDDRLSEYQYTRGMALLNVLRSTTEDASNATVNVLANRKEVCYGTIVDDAGWIVSKASEIDAAGEGAQLSVHLADSRRFIAELVHVDRQYDTAWLKIPGDNLPKIQWSEEASPGVSTWVISTSRGRTPLSAGVVSVAARSIRATPGFMGVGGARDRSDAFVDRILPKSGASRSDLKQGDVIVAVNNVVVNTFPELTRQVRKYLPGDAIHLRVMRDGEEKKVTLRLGHPRNPDADEDEEEMMGRLSDRRDGFPNAFRHDSVLNPEECGGPVIDLNGKIIGVNIARKQRTGSLALPVETLKRLLGVAKEKSKQPAEAKS